MLVKGLNVINRIIRNDNGVFKDGRKRKLNVIDFSFLWLEINKYGLKLINLEKIIKVFYLEKWR